jgi:hypothetical protein
MLMESGDSIEAAMDAAEQRAEDEGDIGASPALMRQLGDNLGNSLEAMLNPQNRGEELAAERFSNSPLDPYEVFRAASDESQRIFENRDNNRNVSVDNGQAQGPSAWMGISGKPGEGEMVSGADFREASKASESRYDFRHMLTLMEPNDDGSFLTPAEMIEELQKGMSDTQVAEYVKEFLDEGNLLQGFKGGNISDFRNDLEELVETTEGLDKAKEVRRFKQKAEEVAIEGKKPQRQITVMPDAETIEDFSGAANENLTKAFYTSIYAYPEAGRSDVRARLPYIFDDTRTLFFLEYGPEAFGVNGWMQKMVLASEEDKKETLGTMEDRYKTFLAEYLTDPTSKRSGENFRDNLALISDTLSQAAANPDRTTWSPEFTDREYWIEAMFGATGEEFAKRNRENLIKMAASQGGMGYYSSLIHRSVDRVMDYYRNIGWNEEDIFAEMARMTRSPVEGPDAFQPVVRVAKQVEEVTTAREAGLRPPGGADPIWDEEFRSQQTGSGDLGELGDPDDILDRDVERHPGVAEAVAAAQKQRDEGDFSGTFPLEGSPRPGPEFGGLDPMAYDWEFSARLPRGAGADTVYGTGLDVDPMLRGEQHLPSFSPPSRIQPGTIGTVYGTGPTMDPMLRGEPVDDAYEIDRILYNSGVEPVAREFAGPPLNTAIPRPFDTPMIAPSTPSNVPTRLFGPDIDPMIRGREVKNGKSPWSKFIPW